MPFVQVHRVLELTGDQAGQHQDTPLLQRGQLVTGMWGHWQRVCTRNKGAHEWLRWTFALFSAHKSWAYLDGRRNGCGSCRRRGRLGIVLIEQVAQTHSFRAFGAVLRGTVIIAAEQVAHSLLLLPVRWLYRRVPAAADARHVGRRRGRRSSTVRRGAASGMHHPGWCVPTRTQRVQRDYIDCRARGYQQAQAH